MTWGTIEGPIIDGLPVMDAYETVVVKTGGGGGGGGSWGSGYDTPYPFWGTPKFQNGKNLCMCARLVVNC